MLTADIAKMYRQVLVDERDHDFNISYAAPYIAVRSLHYLADQHESQYHLA